MEISVWSLFCCEVLSVVFSFVNIFLGGGGGSRAGCFSLIAFGCYVTVNVLLLFLTVTWFCLQCMIVASPGHTHLFCMCVFVCLLIWLPLKPVK